MRSTLRQEMGYVEQSRVLEQKQKAMVQSMLERKNGDGCSLGKRKGEESSGK